MNLVVSMVVRDELGRYLRQTIEHALTYCDEVRVLDDGSTDGTYEYLAGLDRVAVRHHTGTAWAEHEGQARQAAWEWTLEGSPTHVLALDADELVPGGQVVRDALGSLDEYAVWTLRMVEVWQRDPWRIRVDGGWRPHSVPILFRAEPAAASRIADLQLACGRTPLSVVDAYNAGLGCSLPLDVLHLGWSDPEEREARAQRYFEIDGGRFHASAHLSSILDERQVRLRDYPAPSL